VIYDALREHFAAGGLEVEEHPEQGWVATDGFGEHGSWLLVGQAYEDRGQAAVFSVLPEHVPAERRAAVAELLTRINYGLIVGAFVIDLDDGEVRLRAAIDLGGQAPTDALLRPLTATALLQFDRWLPAMRAVIGGEEPSAAFARGTAARG